MGKIAARKDVISKSQYMKGLQCPKALWLYRYRKELGTPFSKATKQRLAIGDNIGELAKQYFLTKGSTAEVEAQFWDVESGLQQTRYFFAKELRDIIFEATAATEKAYSRIDILQRGTYGQVDLIEVKAATKVKSYHIEDMAFQHYIFHSAGYSIRACYMLLVDNCYIRQGELELDKLFYLQDVSSSVLARQRKVLESCNEFSHMLSNPKEPQIEMGRHCYQPFECEYARYCLSIRKPLQGELFATELLPSPASSTHFTHSNQALQNQNSKGRNSKGQNSRAGLKPYPKYYQIRTKPLQRWLNQFCYPLHFLSYSGFTNPLPLFDHCRPYQIIPFQFSLQIQYQENAPLEHLEHSHFLYLAEDRNKAPSDPRQTFIQTLLQYCKEEGSIIVYDDVLKPFESFINQSLAYDFPDYKKALLALNARMKNLHLPFQNYWLYNPAQQGRTSLKTVLAIFTSLDHENINIIDRQNNVLNDYLEMVIQPQENIYKNFEQNGILKTQALALLFNAIPRELSQIPIIRHRKASPDFPSSGLLFDIPRSSP